MPTAVTPTAPVQFQYTIPLVARLVAPVPPLATGSVPVTHVVSGRPVTFVITPLAGVPRAGVVRIGEVSVLFVRV